MRELLGNRRAIALFIGPALTVYTLIMLIPIVWSLGYTFVEGSVITGFTFTGLDNYRTLGSDPSFWSATFSINGTLKVFDSVLALTNGGPGDTTTPLTLYVYNTAFSFGDYGYGYGSTIAMQLTLLSLLVTLVVFRYARKDLTR